MILWREREIDQIVARLREGKIVLIGGFRGSGKTTAMKEVARRLATREHDQQAVVFLDLEDPRMAPRPKKETLELFARSVSDHRPSRKTWIFLDEIGRIPEWLDWARDFMARTGAGILASSSVVPWMDEPKHYQGIETIHFHPLSLKDWLYELTDKSVDVDNAREELPAFLRTGGLPACWVGSDLAKSQFDVFYRSLLQDILLMHEVRDVAKLTAVSVYLISSSAQAVSASHMKGMLARSVDQARGFLKHITRAGMVHLIPRLEEGEGSKPQSARLCFAADCGMAFSLSSQSNILRNLAATATFLEFCRMHETVRAWRRKGRLGLAVVREGKPWVLVDVEYGTSKTADHAPLAAAMSHYKCPRGLLLTEEQVAGIQVVRAGIVARQPIWSWLLQPGLEDRLWRQGEQRESQIVEERSAPRVRTQAPKADPGPPESEPEGTPDGLPPHLL